MSSIASEEEISSGALGVRGPLGDPRTGEGGGVDMSDDMSEDDGEFRSSNASTVSGSELGCPGARTGGGVIIATGVFGDRGRSARTVRGVSEELGSGGGLGGGDGGGIDSSDTRAPLTPGNSVS